MNEGRATGNRDAPCMWVTKIFVSFDILTLLSSENGCWANWRTVPSAQSTTAGVIRERRVAKRQEVRTPQCAATKSIEHET